MFKLNVCNYKMANSLSIIIIVLLYAATMSASDPTDNVVYVLLSSSKFYFNYRHSGNTLALY